MTNAILDKILVNINQSFYNNENISLRSVDSHIDIININDDFCIDKNSQEFYDFILIKNKDTQSNIKYIGIILDMSSDLHFYIISDFRGQGYLQRIMCTSILPFLSFYKGRTKQVLTFEKLKIKEYFIKQFNFKSIDTLTVEKDLDSEDIKIYDTKKEKSIELTDELKEKMINNLNDGILKIRMIHRQLQYRKYNTFDDVKKYLYDEYWGIRNDIRNKDLNYEN